MAASMPEGTDRLALRSWVGARASGTGRNSSACRRPQRRWWKMLVEDAGGIRMPASSTTNIPGGTMTASSRHTETAISALFVGGSVDNSELAYDGNEPPLNSQHSTHIGRPACREGGSRHV